MANVRQQELATNNTFYRDKYSSVIGAIYIAFLLLIILVIMVLYQVSHRPLPEFHAKAANGQQMALTASTEPNLLSTTIIKWASKAAVTAYTFDFVNYQKQENDARFYFTEAGWADFQNSLQALIGRIRQNQLFVNAVVSGAPVISNEGNLPKTGYTWRVQIPFLVTYQSAGAVTHQGFTVILTIVRVPTTINPAGIGVEQFVMQ